MASSNSILFYSKKDPYYEFSNFYGVDDDKNYRLIIDDQGWLSTEHYQTSKFIYPESTPESLEYAHLVGTASTPNKAYILARQRMKGVGIHSARNKN